MKNKSKLGNAAEINGKPYIWLQEYQAGSEAECGCYLSSNGPDDEPGAAFYQCRLHEEANARLIAGAPDLLKAANGDDGAEEVLSDIETWLECQSQTREVGEHLQRVTKALSSLRAAIRKAEEGK